MALQRGRPRMDNSSTQKERRRTQVRLAQRAYRQRKEVTISQLSMKVRSLEYIIGEMNRSFSEFDEHVMIAGVLDPSLAEDYGRTVEQFHELVENGAHESSDKDEYEQPAVPEIDSQSSKDARISPKKIGRPRKRTHEDMIESTSHFERAPMVDYQSAFQADFESDDRHSSQNSTHQAGHSQNYDWDMVEPTPLSSDEAGMIQLHHTGHQDTQQAGIDLEVDMTQQHSSRPDETHQYGISDPEMMPPLQYSNTRISTELPLPSSYSHYETSFVRRLIRASLEESYKLLLNPGSRPDDLQRLCTFAFCFIKVPKILQLFQDVMMRTACENLEMWTVPFYHVGDAGLHYPRVGIDASSEPPPGWANKGSMGPFPVPQPEKPVPEGIADILEYSGVDGEWFDSNDVVEYLGSKGLHLDINSSIVEITDTDEAVSQRSFLNLEKGSLDHSSGLSSMATDFFHTDDTFWRRDPILWSQTSGISPEGFNTDINTGFLETTLNEKYPDLAMLSGLIPPPPPFPMRMKRYLDVENFIRSLTKTTTCLGRTICFRRAAVDFALEQATTETFDDSYFLG